MIPFITICDKAEAQSRLLNNSKIPAAVISIGFKDEAPKGFCSIDDRLRLLFDDTIPPNEYAPSKSHIEDIIKFSKRAHEKNAVEILIHCQSGVSRSTAAAIIARIACGQNLYKAAMNVFYSTKNYYRWPNEHMIKLADDIFNLRGELVKTVNAYCDIQIKAIR